MLALPVAVVPGQAEQTGVRAPRSFVRWGAPPWRPNPGPLPGGWDDGDGKIRRARCVRPHGVLRPCPSRARQEGHQGGITGTRGQGEIVPDLERSSLRGCELRSCKL